MVFPMFFTPLRVVSGSQDGLYFSQGSQVSLTTWVRIRVLAVEPSALANGWVPCDRRDDVLNGDKPKMLAPVENVMFVFVGV